MDSGKPETCVGEKYTISEVPARLLPPEFFRHLAAKKAGPFGPADVSRFVIAGVLLRSG